MGRIHAILPDGTTVKNVEVFRRTYEILGMGWVYAVTKLPVLGADRQLAVRNLGQLAAEADGKAGFSNNYERSNSADRVRKSGQLPTQLKMSHI